MHHYQIQMLESLGLDFIFSSSFMFNREIAALVSAMLDPKENTSF
jgi:hypothetical protein